MWEDGDLEFVEHDSSDEVIDANPYEEHEHPRDLKGKWINVPGLKSWLNVPQTDGDWAQVPGQNHDINEPALPKLDSYSYTDKSGKKIKVEQRLSSGVIIREPDGRTWLVKPTNGYGGYNYTFPKGGVERGLSAQANAIKEAYEESGLKVRITGYAGDYRGDTSVTRMYHAVRETGHPKDHGWETEGVALVHAPEAFDLLNRSRDKKIAFHHLLTKVKDGGPGSGPNFGEPHPHKGKIKITQGEDGLWHWKAKNPNEGRDIIGFETSEKKAIANAEKAAATGQKSKSNVGSGTLQKYGLDEKDAELLAEWKAGGKSYSNLQKSKDFDKVLEKLPRQTGTVWRGLDSKPSEMKSLNIGAEFTMNKHTSTSKSQKSAREFADGYLIEMDQKSGRKLPRGFETDYAESEIVIPRGTKYKIISVVKKNDVTHVRVKEISSVKDGGPGSGPNFGEPHPHKGSGKKLTPDELESFKPRWEAIAEKDRQKMQDAMEEWMGYGYESINKALRSGDEYDWTTGEQQTHIRRLDRIFDQAGHTLNEDTMVYRGIAGDDVSFKENDEFTDRGFQSTTNHFVTAKLFSKGEDTGLPGGVVLHVTVPKGTTVVAPSVPSQDPYDKGEDISAEPEILLRRGTKYRVTKVAGTDVHVRVIK